MKRLSKLVCGASMVALLTMVGFSLSGQRDYVEVNDDQTLALRGGQVVCQYVKVDSYCNDLALCRAAVASRCPGGPKWGFDGPGGNTGVLYGGSCYNPCGLNCGLQTTGYLDCNGNPGPY